MRLTIRFGSHVRNIHRHAFPERKQKRVSVTHIHVLQEQGICPVSRIYKRAVFFKCHTHLCKQSLKRHHDRAAAIPHDFRTHRDTGFSYRLKIIYPVCESRNLTFPIRKITGLVPYICYKIKCSCILWNKQHNR